MCTRPRLTLLLLLASLGLSFGARAAEPVLGVALAVDSPDEATAVDPKPIKPKAVPHKTTTPAPKVEISDGIDLEADLKAIERGHVQVEAASKRTEAAMDRETHRAQQIQKQKQDLMIPDAEMAMITKNRTMGLVLLKHRDSSIQDLQKSVGSLKSEVDKIQASNSLLSDKLLKVEDKQKESQRQAKEVIELQTEEANLQEQLGQLLAQSKVAERDSVTAAIREGDNLEDANQKEALLKTENRKLRAQNAVLKKQIAAQLRALKAKRSELGKASNVLKTEASQQTHMIQVLRANRTRLQKEVDALSHEDARWRRKVAHLKPLEAKVQQEAGREDKLMKASAALAKNLKKAQVSLAGLSESKLETTAQRLDKEEVILKADQLGTEKKILKHQAEMREMDRQTVKLQKQLQLARAGRLKRVVDSQRVKRMAKANQRLRTSVKLLVQKLKTIKTENAKLGATIEAASSDANKAEAVSA